MSPEQPVVISPPMIRNDNAQAFAVLKEILKALRQGLVREVIEFPLIAHGRVFEGRPDIGHTGDDCQGTFRNDASQLQAQRLSFLRAFSKHGVFC
nr:hypothetical protein [Rhizobium leguminosarum]